jgi:DNA-binding NarL/FixJ family response regulator
MTLLPVEEGANRGCLTLAAIAMGGTTHSRGAWGRCPVVLYPPTVRMLMRSYLEHPESGLNSPLSPREEEVAKLVAEGHSTEQIARLLTISPKTVERHRENILAKLGMRDRFQLTRWAIRHGLVDP